MSGKIHDLNQKINETERHIHRLYWYELVVADIEELIGPCDKIQDIKNILNKCDTFKLLNFQSDDLTEMVEQELVLCCFNVIKSLKESNAKIIWNKIFKRLADNNCFNDQNIDYFNSAMKLLEESHWGVETDCHDSAKTDMIEEIGLQIEI
jgi:hypothetical protein